MNEITREQYLALKLFAAAFSNRRMFKKKGSLMVEQLASIGSDIGINIDAYIEDDDDFSAKQWRGIQNILSSRLSEVKCPSDDKIDFLIAGVSNLFGLSPDENSLLSLAARVETSELISDCLNSICSGNRSIDDLLQNGSRTELPAILGIDRRSCGKALLESSRLFTCGVFTRDSLEDFKLADRFKQIFLVDQPPPEKLFEYLIGKPLTSRLSWNDYDHISDQRDFLERLIGGAVQKSARGINILVYGPPGTGKTELSKVLAARLGKPLLAAGTNGEDGKEPSREERLSSLLSLQHLVEKSGDCLVLVDEAQDLFTAESNFFGRYRHAEGSRVFMHSILEKMPVPTIWVANDIDDFGPAILRRMTHVLELTTPPTSVRSEMWRRMLSDAGIEHQEADVRQLSVDFSVPPAVAASAARAAALSEGGLSDLRMAAKSIGGIIGGKISEERPRFSEFDLKLSVADCDLSLITQRLSLPSASRQFSICCYGPPGTGKSDFARHIAKSIGIDVIFKRYSDLSSKWVGESERKIAAAFREASAAKAMLILDEADSLLGSRSSGSQSWEITQVNEMLTWMESHPYPFICTTNLMDRMDPASLRRFTFKIQFKYLSPDQVEYAFLHFFGVAAPSHIRKMTLLTPGDFAVVQKKAEVLGLTSDQDALMDMLAAEQASKPNYAKSIGFV